METLPTEIIYDIASHLRQNDIRPFSMVCHRFNQVALSRLFHAWRIPGGADKDFIDVSTDLSNPDPSEDQISSSTIDALARHKLNIRRKQNLACKNARHVWMMDFDNDPSRLAQAFFDTGVPEVDELESFGERVSAIKANLYQVINNLIAPFSNVTHVWYKQLSGLSWEQDLEALRCILHAFPRLVDLNCSVGENDWLYHNPATMSVPDKIPEDHQPPARLKSLSFRFNQLLQIPLNHRQLTKFTERASMFFRSLQSFPNTINTIKEVEFMAEKELFEYYALNQHKPTFPLSLPNLAKVLVSVEEDCPRPYALPLDLESLVRVTNFSLERDQWPPDADQLDTDQVAQILQQCKNIEILRIKTRYNMRLETDTDINLIFPDLEAHCQNFGHALKAIYVDLFINIGRLRSLPPGTPVKYPRLGYKRYSAWYNVVRSEYGSARLVVGASCECLDAHNSCELLRVDDRGERLSAGL